MQKCCALGTRNELTTLLARGKSLWKLLSFALTIFLPITIWAVRFIRKEMMTGQ